MFYSSFSQLVFSSDSTVKFGTLDDLEIIPEIELTNNTLDTFIVWTRTYVNIPDGWENAVCDNVACWLPDKSTHTMKVKKGESIKFSVHFAPDGMTDGKGEVQISFRPVNSQEPKVVKFYGSTLDPNSTSDTFDTENFIAYPSVLSSNNLLYTNDLAKNYRLFSITGQEIDLQNSIVNNYTLSIPNLSKGNYILKHQNGYNQQITIIE
jgi:hypothetical protein